MVPSHLIGIRTPQPTIKEPQSMTKKNDIPTAFWATLIIGTIAAALSPRFFNNIWGRHRTPEEEQAWRAAKETSPIDS